MAAAERQAADQLHRLDEVKNSFPNAVSHELRTPLTVVRGMAATLVRVGTVLDAQTRSDLERAIERHATTLSGLLDELLDLDRLARGTLTTEWAPGTLRLEVIDEAPGIASKEREQVSKPFFRGEDDHPKPGTGIGPALVAEFARLHRGRAWVEPSQRGAHLIVELPGATADAVVP